MASRVVLVFLLQFGYVALAAVSCYTNNPAASSCSQSMSCLAEHPPRQEESECLKMYENSEISTYPPHIESCPTNKHCNSFTTHTANEWQYFRVNAVGLETIAVDPLHFAVNVSWNYSNVEEAINIDRPAGRLQGYELRLLEGDDLAECLCIWGPRVFSTIVGLNRSLRYRPSLANLQARVYTLPLGTNRLESTYAKESEQPMTWPATCNAGGILCNSQFCPPRLYQQPRHILLRSTVMPDSTKEIQVSWSSPLSEHAPTPLSYYLYCTDQKKNYTFLVNGTYTVTIAGLDPNQNYSIQIQAYYPCSGTSSFSSTSGSGEISCGELSLPVPEDVVAPSTTILEPTSTSTVSTTLPTNFHLLLNVTIPLMTVVLAILIVVMVVFIVLRCWKSSSCGKMPVVQNECLQHFPLLFPMFPYRKQQLKVLVLYTLETPKEEQALIEKYVVGRLFHQFEVRSCNNHTENTIVDWVEEQARLAHAVLIVCNKSFYKEWNLPSQQRSALINALATIIQSSVSKGDTKKYATLILGEKSERYIPDYSYMNLMEMFVVKMDSSDKGIEKIEGFVEENH